MCGITGIVDFQGKVKKSDLAKRNSQIVHRGPDSDGFYYEEHVGLAARRLSIIDLVTGDQPIFNEDKSVVIVFNGEIYNYQALYKDLVAAGHKFKTKSDTETLVHAYEQYGPEFIKLLNGMFAFAIWDKKKQRLMLGRDHAGIKPLYYSETSGTLLFGSEPKTILAHPAFKKKLNRSAVDLYTFFGYLPGNVSMYEGMFKLMPGHFALYDKSGLKTVKYYDVNNLTSPKSEDLDILFDEALKIQSIADVPLGVLLSGGLDSSLIAYYLARQKHHVKSFSIAFSESTYDESAYARQIADILETDHYEASFSPKDMLDIFPKVITKLDEPFADSSLFPTYAVSRLARQHVKVALSGDGGDELFGGYPTYQGHILANLIPRVPKNLVSLGQKLLEGSAVSQKNYSTSEVLLNAISGLHLTPAERHLLWMSNQSVGHKKLVAIDSNPVYKTLISQYSSPQQLDFSTYLVDDLLFKSDRASMFNSLELRVPFLDLDIISFAFSKQRSHVDFFTTKKLLRKLLYQKLPPQILDRGSNFMGVKLFRKKGFGIPLFKWLTSDLRPIAEEYLANPDLINFFDMGTVNRHWQQTLSGQRNHSKLIWMVVMFSAWLKEWGRV